MTAFPYVQRGQSKFRKAESQLVDRPPNGGVQNSIRDMQTHLLGSGRVPCNVTEAVIILLIWKDTFCSVITIRLSHFVNSNSITKMYFCFLCAERMEGECCPRVNLNGQRVVRLWILSLSLYGFFTWLDIPSRMCGTRSFTSLSLVLFSNSRFKATLPLYD